MAIRLTVGAVMVVIAVAATGCNTTAGKPQVAHSALTRVPAPASASGTAASPAPSATATSTTSPAAPTGQPIGTATMRVGGGVGPVTVRYQINGGPEQTETNVTLPWEKQYPVYNEVDSSVTADGGDTELSCSIIMDGKLLAFKSEARPTCSFAYWG
jgi:hypothetical protein